MTTDRQVTTLEWLKRTSGYRSPILAFTLAETLITLGIIGVVAAITIPALMNNIQHKDEVAALKKFYSNFNQALMKYSADKDCPGNLECTGILPDLIQLPQLQELKPYFNVLKDCSDGSNGCFSTNVYKDLSGGPVGSMNGVPSLLLEDGSTFRTSFQDCSSYGSGVLNEVCGSLTVDVNGPKPPNQIGRDYFSFFITNSAQLAPYGSHLASSAGYHWDDNTNGNACNPATFPGGDGGNCAGRIIEQNWEMNY